MQTPAVNLWGSPEHALQYLARVDSIPHRTEGEAALLEWLPPSTARVLDLGSGNGRLVELIARARPSAQAIAVDFSDTMLAELRTKSASNPWLTVVGHDLARPLPASLGTFDVVASSFAIHHLEHERKRALYGEVYDLLRPGGMFLNLEHVASPTATLHASFLACLGVTTEDEDPSNKLLDLETQLSWLRSIGYEEVDCHWKWRELALLAGMRPAAR
jgi:tRNA (cmo5U34)-methyltransferase